MLKEFLQSLHLVDLPRDQILVRSVRVIGQGGLGFVEEVHVTRGNHRHRGGERLARKRLLPKWAGQPEHRARFDREIQAVGAMNHPAIVALQGVNLPGQERFYLMKLYPCSLRDVLVARRGPIPWEATARIGTILADALAHAHGKSFIHRDIKPENILLDASGNPVISDWGLGYFVHQFSTVLDLTMGGMGTVYYCSPEQWATGKCGPSGDVYSLGIVLAEMVMGQRAALPGQGIRGDVTSARDAGARCFNRVVLGMTRPRAHERFQSMTEVAASLRSALAHSALPVQPRRY